MEKIIEGMGKIEFGKFYNNKNKIIYSLEDTPIIDSQKVQNISLNQLRKLLDNEYMYYLLDKLSNFHYLKYYLLYSKELP